MENSDDNDEEADKHSMPVETSDKSSPETPKPTMKTSDKNDHETSSHVCEICDKSFCDMTNIILKCTLEIFMKVQRISHVVFVVRLIPKEVI